MLLKSHISKSIKGSIPGNDQVKTYMKAIEEQFVRSDKSMSSTIMIKLSSMRFDNSKGVQEHMMEMRAITAKLRPLEVEISKFFLVHLILNSLPPEYGTFKISYNTHKDK